MLIAKMHLLFYFFAILFILEAKSRINFYTYSFITTLPQKSFFNRNICNLVVTRLLKIIGKEGIIIIFIYGDKNIYNISCFRCIFLNIKEYHNVLSYIVELIYMELLSFIK